MKKSSFIFLICLFHAISAFGQEEKSSITYFLIDGLSNEVFKQLLAEGELPVMDSLIQSGLYVENGIVSFPSITGFSYYPYLTGVDAAESGIFGLRWFDRTRDEGNLRNYVGRTNVYMNEDIQKDIPTIFELYDDDYTATINSFMNRGAKESMKTGWMFTTAKYGSSNLFGKLKDIPVIGKKIGQNHINHELNVLEKAITQLGENPQVHWVTFASPDAFHHIEGMGSGYSELLKHIDRLIGEYISESKTLGQMSRHFAIISDHGVADVSHNVDPCKLLKTDLNLNIERGLATELWRGRLDRPLTDMEAKQGYLAINGNLTAFLYMTDQKKEFPDNWRKRLFYDDLVDYGDEHKDILDYLSNMQGMDLLICSRDMDAHWVINGESRALIQVRGDSIKYEVLTPKDPLTYMSHDATRALMNGAYIHQSLWQSASLGTRYPDALCRISALMNKENSPDIVMCSAVGYDFGQDYEIFVNNYKGGHGGMRDEMINVPFILSGPKVKKEYLSILRSEDLGKRILELVKD